MDIVPDGCKVAISDAEYTVLIQLNVTEAVMLNIYDDDDGVERIGFVIANKPVIFKSTDISGRISLDTGSAKLVQVTDLPYLPSGALDLVTLVRTRRALGVSLAGQEVEAVRLAEFEEGVSFAKMNASTAILEGPKLLCPTGTPSDLMGVLERAAASSSHCIHLVQADGSDVSFSYAELLKRARCVCGGLLGTDLPTGTPVVFQLADAANIFALFWGAILAGWRPVPQALPTVYATNNQLSNKLLSTLVSLPDAILVAERTNLGGCEAFCRQNSSRKIHTLTIDELLTSEPGHRSTAADQDEIAVILQTSGSTSAPKMVPQTHRRLINRCVATIEFNGFSSSDVTLNCFPLDHVCGLIMFHLRDVFLACRQIHVKVESFLRDPVIMLELCDRFGVTATWAPNFAFNLINARRKDIESRQFDLRRLRFVENCAEAVVVSQNLDFLSLIRRFGAPADAIKPAWGMSETCSVITLSNEFHPSIVNEGTRFVRLGKVYAGCKVRVVDDAGTLVLQGTIGSLQVTGATVFDGYLNNPTVNAESFTHDGWFDTGDLAVIVDGELAIVGRAKDSIIINGNNIGGHEIEECVDRIDGVEPSCTAAIAVRSDTDPTDRIAIFFHTHRIGNELAKLLSDIRQAVTRQFGALPEFFVPVMPSDVPKTSVGKIQKERLRAAFQEGRIKPTKLDRCARQFPPKQRIDSVSEIRWKLRELPEQGRSRKVSSLRHIVLISEERMNDGDVSSVCLDSPWAGVYHFAANSLAFGKIDLSECDAVAVLLNDNESSEVVLDQLLDRLVRLKQLLTSIAAAEGIQRKPIYVITQLAQDIEFLQERINLADSSLSAFIASVAMERKDLILRQIDVADISGILALIAKEFMTFHSESQVAYRYGRRFVRRFFSLTEVHAGPKCLASSGVVVIAGGAGGIGLNLAERLLVQGQKRIVMLGRSNESELEGRSLEKIRQLGKLYPGTIDYRTTDICDTAAVRNVFAALAAAGEVPARIFHLAGVFNEHAALNFDRPLAHESLAAKVSGTLHLLEAAEAHWIPELILFTSVNGVLGGAGAAIYSVANRFQETLRISARLHKSRTTVRTFAWSMWDDVGMSSGKQTQQFVELAGYKVLQADSALDTLEKLLHDTSHAHIIGLKLDSPRLKSVVDWPCAPGVVVTKTSPRPLIPLIPSCKVELSAVLCEIWNEVLLRDDIKSSDNIFDIGGTSLALLSVANLLEHRIGLKVTAADFFEFPYISDFSSAMSTRKFPHVAQVIDA